MHRVGGAGCSAGSTRPRKEKRLTYVINHADNTKHCAGINCLAYLNASVPGTSDYLFTGSRDGTLRRWEIKESDATFSATFESHVDWVNDAIIVGQSLVSCSSDTTLKIWDCCSDGACTRTLSGHSDYVICLAAAEKNSNVVASGGLGGEVLIWDLDAALSPVTKSVEATEDKVPNGNFGPSMETLRNLNSNVINNGQSHGYSPIAAKGHKESVYALAMNDAGNLLVSGGTEKIIRVWDPRTGTKNMKLRGPTDNIRALVLDSAGRYCLSGSSDSMIRLWDIGQQRCIHSYAVHTDSVWALAITPSFTHVYSGGRDQAMYLTDLLTRESVLLCTKEHPILQLSFQDDKIWAATTDSSVYGWPAEGQSLQKVFQRGSSFLAGNLSFSRARASLEGSAPVPVYKEPSFTIPGVPAIVQHEILNNRRHVLTKDTAGSVKSWDITRGVVIEDFGKVSFEDKINELFEMATIPAWFTMDARLGCLSVHLDTPQCFSAESYEVDLNIAGAQEEKKVNLAQETLCGLLFRLQPQLNGDSSTGKESSFRNLPPPNSEVDDKPKNRASKAHPAFEFSTTSPPSIITEGSYGGPWRKRITDLVGTEGEEYIPKWCVDCKFEGEFPREAAKCRFFLRPTEGSPVSNIREDKLIAPWISRILNAAIFVITYLPAGLLNGSSDGIQPLQKLKPSVDILCNDQVVSPDMTLFQVRAYIWKRPEDLVLYYRVALLRKLHP